MGIFGFGKKKKNKKEKEQVNTQKSTNVPKLFDSENVSKLVDKIKLIDNQSDFGVKVDETIYNVFTSKEIVEKRVKILTKLSNYKTGEKLFSKEGITPASYKQECAVIEKYLNCRFISETDKAVEVSRYYGLKLVKEDLIEFWQVLQLSSLLSNRTAAWDLKISTVWDRLYQAMIAVDVDRVKLVEAIERIIKQSYQKKMTYEDRAIQQLQLLLEEICKEYEIEDETWEQVNKFLGGVINPGFYKKLEAHDIELSDGFTIEARVQENTEKNLIEEAVDEEISEFDNFTVNVDEENFSENKKSDGSEAKSIIEQAEKLAQERAEKLEEQSKATLVEFEDEFDSAITKSSQDLGSSYEPGVSSVASSILDSAIKVDSQYVENFNSEETKIGQPLFMDDSSDFEVKSFKESNFEIDSIEKHKEELKLKYDNVSNFKFEKLDGAKMLGKEFFVFLKASELMRTYYRKDNFSGMLNTILHLSMGLNSSKGVQNCILQICNSKYNPMEINFELFDDLLETLNNGGVETTVFNFTSVLDDIAELMENKEGRIVFIIYDSIIDKTTSISKMRKMSKIFEKNKFIFIQLDTSKPNNFKELFEKEESLFTNCRFILADTSVVSDSIKMGSTVKEAVLE